MKNITRRTGMRRSAAGLILLLFSGCFKDKITMTYKFLSPVYTTQSTVVANVKGDPDQSFDSIGKISVLGNTIFVNEIGKGIHVIDNSNPRHPVQTAFMNIPGNIDMAIQGNVLYADMYSNLLAIDITDIHSPKMLSLLQNMFYGYFSTNGTIVYDNEGNLIDNNKILTGWVMKDTTVPANTAYMGIIPGGPCINCVFNDLAGAAPSTASSASSTGVTGSMAKMTILNDHLYAIDERHELGNVNLANPAKLTLTRTPSAGYDLETIYPFGNQLFLGSQEGVFIYDVSNADHPQKKGNFTHGTACDPVISDGDYAYVTLHSGTYCGGASNELDVVNVQDLSSPFFVKSYPMNRPQGLCKDGNLLFVCDGETGGVKLYDATDPANMQLITQIGQTNAFDVIAANHHLIVVAADGIYQYDYTDTHNVATMSTITLK